MIVNYLVLFTLLCYQYPVAAHILTHSVNLAWLATWIGIQKKCRARDGLQNEARLELCFDASWMVERFHNQLLMKTLAIQKLNWCNEARAPELCASAHTQRNCLGAIAGWHKPPRTYRKQSPVRKCQIVCERLHPL